MAKPDDITRIQRDAVAEILRQLEIARRRIAQQLAAAGSEPSRARLRALQADVENHLGTWRKAATGTVSASAAHAIASGVGEVSSAISRAIGVDLTPRINPAALRSMSVALTDLVTDVSVGTKNRINSQLAQVLIGTRSMSDAITAVDRIIDGPTRSRARMIVQTELGRIHSAATQAGMEESAKRIPMKKEWMRSGRKHPRPEHQAAHGQVRAVDEPFDVGGEKLMYPRDPNGSAKNTINCGCRHRPKVDVDAWVNMEDLPPAPVATNPTTPVMQHQPHVPVAGVAQGGITPPNIISSPGGILGGGGGMLPPMPPNPASPRDPNETARQSLSRFYANTQALGDVPGRRLVRSLWTNITRYADHVEKRIRNGAITNADELARRTLETLAAAELSKIAMYELPTVLLQVTATGWIVLVNANGRIVSSYPFDPDADSFDQRAAHWKVSSHDYVLTPADREVLARLFHGR